MGDKTMTKSDNILRVRLDVPHWQMLNELCQNHDRVLADMVRKLIRDEHARMGKGEKQNGK